MAEETATHRSGSFDRSSAIGFVGAGRLGSSLAIALDRAGYRVVALSSRRADHRRWLQSRLPDAAVHAGPDEVSAESDIVFVTTSDSAVREVAESVRWRPGQAVVHCSGAVSLSALESAAASGAAIGGFHPMQTFPTPDSADSLRQIAFGIESPDPALFEWLSSLANELDGWTYELTSERRAAYHTAAVMACGLLAGLTGLAAEVWASAGGISREKALESLTPLVKTTANSLAENGLPNALTGPYVRGDAETVRAHLQATSDVSAEMGAAYSALANAALHIAREQGNLTPEVEQSIKHILRTTLQESCGKIEEA